MTLPKGLVLIVLLLCCWGGTPVLCCLAAEDSKAVASEYPVKAAYVYNFIKFTEWPASVVDTADGRLIIAVLGNDEQVAALEELNGKTAQGKVIQVKRISSDGHLSTSHVLFVCRDEENRLAKILNQCQHKPILTISSLPGFAEAGGGIGFYIADNKVRFKINPDSTKRAGLTISSRLLSLARIVTSAGP